MVIFHSYVSLPEGKWFFSIILADYQMITMGNFSIVCVFLYRVYTSLAPALNCSGQILSANKPQRSFHLRVLYKPLKTLGFLGGWFFNRNNYHRLPPGNMPATPRSGSRPRLGKSDKSSKQWICKPSKRLNIRPYKFINV